MKKLDKYMTIITICGSNGIKTFRSKEEAINFLIKIIGIKTHDDMMIQESKKLLEQGKTVQIQEVEYSIQYI